MKVQPYLYFNGRCEEAIEFYEPALGAEILMLMRFNENPGEPPPGLIPLGSEDKIMHASFRIGERSHGLGQARHGHSGGPGYFACALRP